MLRRVRFRRMFVTALILLLTLAPYELPARAAPTILINEFMPRPSSGDAEWAELFNVGSLAIDISGWKIDNNTVGGTQMVLPAGSVIQSNSLLVITRTGDILGISDTIKLLDLSNSVIDSHVYESAATGKSFARIPDGSDTWQIGGSPQYPSSHTQGTWNAQSAPTPTSTYAPSQTNTTQDTPTATPTATAIVPTNTPSPTSTPTPSPTATPYPTGILLNEFLAYPKTLYTSEWIELYNTNISAVDLTGWKICIRSLLRLADASAYHSD
jgi:hypothetical protein